MPELKLINDLKLDRDYGGDDSGSDGFDEQCDFCQREILENENFYLLSHDLSYSEMNEGSYQTIILDSWEGIIICRNDVCRLQLSKSLTPVVSEYVSEMVEKGLKIYPEITIIDSSFSEEDVEDSFENTSDSVISRPSDVSPLRYCCNFCETSPNEEESIVSIDFTLFQLIYEEGDITSIDAIVLLMSCPFHTGALLNYYLITRYVSQNNVFERVSKLFDWLISVIAEENSFHPQFDLLYRVLCETRQHDFNSELDEFASELFNALDEETILPQLRYLVHCFVILCDVSYSDSILKGLSSIRDKYSKSIV